MKTIEKLLLGAEIAVTLFALLLPIAFVSYTGAIAQAMFGAKEGAITYAYGLVLAVACATGSLSRKLFFATDYIPRGRRAIILNSIAVLGAALMIYSLATSDALVTDPHAVVSPYFSYLISVFFCVGVGYAAADLLSLLKTGR